MELGTTQGKEYLNQTGRTEKQIMRIHLGAPPAVISGAAAKETEWNRSEGEGTAAHAELGGIQPTEEETPRRRWRRTKF